MKVIIQNYLNCITIFFKIVDIEAVEEENEDEEGNEDDEGDEEEYDEEEESNPYEVQDNNLYGVPD